jgi:Icc-related predicted phosphoesterase
MRIIAFSDLHRDQAASRAIVAASTEADVVVGAGDFATHGAGIDETLGILGGIKVPLVLVAGNHDDLSDLRAAARGRPGWHVLHGETAKLGGVAFFGFGFEVGEMPGALAQSILSEAQAARLLTACPRHAVLVTHSPPHGVADMQRDGSHQGSRRAIRACVEAQAPRLHVCGHIHHAWGTTGDIAGCPVVNLGPTPRVFEV